jgi:2-iminobutanoate/2-iminopropanoate deaminase
MSATETVPAAKEAISTGEAPAAIGPYSQAIRAGGMLFVSGQLPISPGAAAGTPLPTAFAEQTAQALANLRAVVEAGGLTLDDVVKTTIFTTDLTRFGEINDAYASVFSSPTPPARATVQVAALPAGAGVEIEAVAVRGAGVHG